MAEWIGLKFGVERSYRSMEALVKFYTIWGYQSDTPFTVLPAGQKLDGIFGRNWLDEMILIFACSHHIGNVRSWINFKIFEAI